MAAGAGLVSMKTAVAIAWGVMLLSECADRPLPAPDTTWAQRYAFFLPPSKGVCSEWTHSTGYEYQDTIFFDRDRRTVILRARFSLAATPQGECSGRVRKTVVNGLTRRDQVGGSANQRCRTTIIEKPQWGRYAFAYSGLDRVQAARADAIIDGVCWGGIPDLPSLYTNPDEILPCTAGAS
jgi:hypothetical protein